MKANSERTSLNSEAMLHQIELLRASCDRNSPELAVTLARQLGGRARLYGMDYIASLTERLEFAVLNKQPTAVDEYLKTLEDLIIIPPNAVQLSL